MSVFPDTPINEFPVGDPKEAYLNQGSPVQNTWYDVLDISTSGFLIGLKGQKDQVTTALEMRITIDGGTPQVTSEDLSSLERVNTHVSTGDYAHWPLVLARFAVSLKVEIRTTGAGVTDIDGKVFYTEDQ